MILAIPDFKELKDRVVAFAKEHPLQTAGAAAGAYVAYSILFPGRLASEVDEPNCANFNSWMKVEPTEAEPEYQPANFNSFIKPAGGAAPSKAKAAPVAVKPSKNTSTGMVVMYGTEYGFSKEIAEKLTKKLNSQGVHPRLLNMADFPKGLDLSNEKAILMCCSTQGDGVPPNEAREFVEWLDSAGANKLNSIPFSVLALGDMSYEHFCACGKRLDARLEALGASRAFPRFDVNKEDWKMVDEWIEGVCNKVTELGIQTAAPAVNVLADITNTVNGDAPAKKKYSRSNPFLATVTRVQGLCNVTSKDDKDTVQVEFDLGDSGLEYMPGDALGVVPRNCPKKVTELLQVWGVDGNTEITLPSWKGQVNSAIAAAEMLPLRAALVSCYDIRQPKPDIFAVLKAGYDRLTAGGTQLTAEGMRQAEQLRALTDGSDKAAKAREDYLTGRHLVDVLAAFPTARPTVAELLPCLRQLQARLYSISSSQRENKGRVQITVAIVRYDLLGSDRIGVCSTFVGERMELGSQVPIFISKNADFRLPKSLATPIIMVGPGTGLAPFRSFIQDRILTGQDYGESVLFFGCRRSDQDYLYGPVLENWNAEGKIKLFTAFSREGKAKVYVQQRIREQGDLIFSLLEKGAHFYVCGDASSMAGQVEEALLELIKQRVPGKTAEAAHSYLEAMRKTDRYQRDVWY